jgi:dihydroorotase-like cyclic amidohydrolase
VAQGCDVPVYALILIEHEIVCDVIRIEDQIPVNVIVEKYEEEGWQITNYENYYVSPGLIDLNVKFNGEWEGIINTTEQAIAGGVTMIIDHGNVYDLPEEDVPRFFCDIGRLAVLD